MLRLDTWRNRARDDSTRHRPLHTYWQSFGATPLSPFSSHFRDNVTLIILVSRPWPFRVTWRHRSRDHSLPRWPFPIGAPLTPSRYLQPFQGPVTSTVTWPFDSQGASSYRHYIVTKSLYSAIFKIMGTEHIGVMNLTFQGHVTSSVTWSSFDSRLAISNRYSVVTKSPSSAVSEIMGNKHISVMILTF